MLDMAQMNIKATTGQLFVVDDSNSSKVTKYNWHFQRYVRAYVNGKTIRLHNYLFGYAPAGLEWDHIDRDTLNNKQRNLRLVTHRENMKNKRIPANNTSGIKGVCWHKRMGCWIAQYKLNGKIKHLGYFEDLDKAAGARRRAELLYD